VLDYGAEGDLFVRSCDDSSVFSDTLHIPHDYLTRFHSTADADSDGLTVWEENRGFIINGTNHRLLADSPDVFANNEGGMLPQCASYIATDAGLEELQPYSEEVQEDRFMDFEARQYSDTGWGRNPLVEPQIQTDVGILPLFLPGHNYGNNHDWQYGRINVRIQRLEGTQGSETWGMDSTYWGLDIPGGGGTAGVLIDTTQIAIDILGWIGPGDFPHRCLGPNDYSAVRDGFKVWAAIHEFGHVFSLPHPNPPEGGPLTCAMTYLNYQNNTPSCSNGEDWQVFLSTTLNPLNYSYQGCPNAAVRFRP
jgi:hypothetical protein